MKKYLAVLIVMSLIEISLAVYLTFWREVFWNNIANKQALAFLEQLGWFSLIALIMCFMSGLSGYLVSLTGIEWRKKLDNIARSKVDGKVLENIPQRIQEDCKEYPSLFLNLVFGIGKSLVYVVVFSCMILISFDYYLLLILLGYSLIGTWITKKIALPLIQLNYQAQKAEATYRTALTNSTFYQCVWIMLGLAKKQKNLNYFQSFYSQVAVVIPIIIIAPVYFTTVMTVGGLMRFTSTASTILDNMAYGITNFASINHLIASRRRLTELGVL